MRTTSLAALAGVAVAAASASAVITVFNDEATYLAAAGPLVFEDFNTATPGVLNAGVVTPAGTVTVEHIGSDGNSFIETGAGANGIDGSMHLDIFIGPEFAGIFPAELFRINLPNPVTAASFELADFFSAGSSEGADVFAGSDFVLNTRAEGLAGTNGIVPPTFIGFTSDTPFDSILFGSDLGFGEAFGIDNLTYSVPAPASAGLLALAGLTASRRRR